MRIPNIRNTVFKLELLNEKWEMESYLNMQSVMHNDPLLLFYYYSPYYIIILDSKFKWFGNVLLIQICWMCNFAVFCLKRIYSKKMVVQFCFEWYYRKPLLNEKLTKNSNSMAAGNKQNMKCSETKNVQFRRRKLGEFVIDGDCFFSSPIQNDNHGL